MGKHSTGAAAGGGAIYGLGIFGALFYFWQQADAFWEYIWAVFPKAILWPAFMVYEVQGARRVTGIGPRPTHREGPTTAMVTRHFSCASSLFTTQGGSTHRRSS